MRFYNSGKYEHVTLNHATGQYTREILDLRPTGKEIGTAIVDIPGIGVVKKAVAKGDWVILVKPNSPDDNRPLSDGEWIERVKRVCPSLLTEEEAAGLEPARSVKPAKG